MALLDIAFRCKSKAAMQTKMHTMISKVAGVEGDFRGEPGKRQVTVLSLEQWQLACRDVAVTLPWTVRRANLLIDGISFNSSMVGQHIKIGELVLLITQETEPCPRMDEQHPGLTQALTPDWRGGVCCTVIADGQVKIGDTVTVQK